MKNRFVITLLLIAAGSVMITSCKKKENSADGGAPTGICYVTLLGPMQFLYTSDNKIEYLLAYDYKGYPMDTIIRYFYNSSGKISIVKYDPGSSSIDYDSILYDGSGRVAYCKSFQNNLPAGTATYLYNSSNQLIEVDLTGYMAKQYSRKAPLVSAAVTYEYDGNGNVRKETVYAGSAGGSIVESFEYTYDAKRSPYYVWNLPVGFGTFNMSKLLSKNNYVKEINFDDYSGETITTTVTYTYNSQGFPTVMTFNDGSGTESYGAQYHCIN